MAKISSKPPSELELVEVIDRAEDLLVVVLRGHQFLEALLNLAISEALPIPHAVEVRRLSLLLKVDLLVALGVIPADCRPSFGKINGLRNRLAHDPHAVITDLDGQETFDALSPAMHRAFARTSDKGAPPRHLITRCILILYAVLEESVTMMRDNKVRSRIWAEIAEETLSIPFGERRKGPYFGRNDERAEAEVEAERERRNATGDL